MCLMAMALYAHPKFPWICIANRDEFHNRPAKPMQFWDTKPDILAGQDLEAGGTWMGFSQAGRFALLTNIRDARLQKGAEAPSRGQLVTQALGDLTESIHRESLEAYSGFNLVYGRLDKLELLYQHNHLDQDAPKHSVLQPGIYGLSNALLDTPWPKTERLKTALSDWIERNQNTSPEVALGQLNGLLNNTELAKDNQLPMTGVPLEWERMLSAIKIVSPAYGTRCSTVAIMDVQKRIYIEETTYLPSGEARLTQHFDVQL